MNRLEYVPKKYAKIKNIFYTLSIIFILWIVLSWLNVINHNLEPGYTFPEWNFFRILLILKGGE